MNLRKGICRMKDLKEAELLQILLQAYQKGEQTNDITTEEMLEEIVLEIKKVYTV
ncbi:hypothetical protein [Metabacillus fastidiosus]|uniref:Uncharacterized protein n=1 Tax=Metabacillus fastidiosus TaxID=1458 RepID=A0ABU6P3J1_9BACI|nr:hypothetical protein [Metabacillus fastidiosus]